MRRFFPPGVVAFLGLGIATGSVQPEVKLPVHNNQDPRGGILRSFLKEKNCPAQDFADVFIAEADNHGLDWRLLPSLAFVESGAGKTSRGNNLFGWDNGKMNFASVNQAIHQVASSLAEARAYKGRSLRGKLANYNQDPEYGPLVVTVMRQIYPRQLVEAAR